ncbi:MAG TPA: hypothetical protein VIM98_15110 [Dyella sp.]
MGVLAPELSVTVKEKANVPAWLGVPLMVLPLKDSPPGSGDPESNVNVYGSLPPVALKDWLYVAPNTGSGSDAGETTIVDAGAILTVTVIGLPLSSAKTKLSINDLPRPSLV